MSGQNGYGTFCIINDRWAGLVARITVDGYTPVLMGETALACVLDGLRPGDYKPAEYQRRVDFYAGALDALRAEKG